MKPIIVIFRKWRNGDIIALFPEESGSTSGLDCSCYEHVGQHGHADYTYVVSQTTPAQESEYQPLLRELTREPFNYVFDVKRRYTKQYFN